MENIYYINAFNVWMWTKYTYGHTLIVNVSSEKSNPKKERDL